MKSKILLSLATLFVLLITRELAASNTTATPILLENKPLDQQPRYCGQSGCDKSFKAILKLAKNGSPKAKMIAGLMYLNGIGTEQDDQKSYRYLIAAARAGLEFAQYAVGTLYIEGKTFERDVDKGNYWLRKAALGGYIPAIKLILKNDASGDEDSLKRLNEIDFASMDKGDGHIVITSEYVTLDDYADYLNKTTPYNRKGSTGSRIRGLHCGETSQNCRTLNDKTVNGEIRLLKMLGLVR